MITSPGSPVWALACRTLACRTLPVILSALAPVAVVHAESAQRWGVERNVEDGGGNQRPVAVVLSNQGDALRVHRGKDGRVALSLRLREGFERFAPDNCPTVQIDDDEARTPGPEGETCSIAVRVATMPLGRIEDEVIHSPVLARLMDGTRLLWRVRLEGLGYREITFTLRGSMQALVDVMGNRTRVER